MRCVPFRGLPPSVPRGWEMHVHLHIVEYAGEQYMRTFHGSRCGKPYFELPTSKAVMQRGIPRGGRGLGK